jgi:hypothetical protein
MCNLAIADSVYLGWEKRENLHVAIHGARDASLHGKRSSDLLAHCSKVKRVRIETTSRFDAGNLHNITRDHSGCLVYRLS